MKELVQEQWRDEQRIELWDAVVLTFTDVDDPKKDYWIDRLYSYFCKRFYGLQCSWLVFLGELDDRGAYGEYRSEKAREYCCMVRDTAYWLTHSTDEHIARICEPVDYYEYFAMAA